MPIQVRKETYNFSPDDGRNVQCIDRIIRQVPIAALWLRGTSTDQLSNAQFRKFRQAKNRLHTNALVMVLRIMAGRRRFIIMFMILIAYFMAKTMHHGVKV